MPNTMRGEWLIPFKGRNPSGPYNQNFLWRHGSTYVMDNHRAALWCWLQHVDPKSAHSLFHIDRHMDTLQSRLDEWLAHLPTSWHMSVEEYLAHSYEMDFAGVGSTRLFRWDNYLSIYLAVFGSSIRNCYFATHNDGDKPNHRSALHVQLWDLPGNLDFWLSDNNKPWIMNIDLDYFFWHNPDDAGLMVSDAYLSRCFEPLRQKIEDGTIAVTTIALTPSEAFTGGWRSSERLAKRVLQFLGIEFQL